jgi:hypothetical protein
LTKKAAAAVSKVGATFAPGARGDGKSKNPATKGTVLYQVFEVQAYLAVVVGGLLAYNIIWPTDDPSIPRLIGMWSLWCALTPHPPLCEAEILYNPPLCGGARFPRLRKRRVSRRRGREPWPASEHSCMLWWSS